MKNVKYSIIHSVNEQAEVIPVKEEALIDVFKHPLYLKQHIQLKRGASSSVITQQPYHYHRDKLVLTLVTSGSSSFFPNTRLSRYLMN